VPSARAAGGMPGMGAGGGAGALMSSTSGPAGGAGGRDADVHPLQSHAGPSAPTQQEDAGAQEKPGAHHCHTSHVALLQQAAAQEAASTAGALDKPPTSLPSSEAGKEQGAEARTADARRKRQISIRLCRHSFGGHGGGGRGGAAPFLFAGAP